MNFIRMLFEPPKYHSWSNRFFYYFFVVAVVLMTSTLIRDLLTNRHFNAIAVDIALVLVCTLFRFSDIIRYIKNKHKS